MTTSTLCCFPQFSRSISFLLSLLLNSSPSSRSGGRMNPFSIFVPREGCLQRLKSSKDCSVTIGHWDLCLSLDLQDCGRTMRSCLRIVRNDFYIFLLFGAIWVCFRDFITDCPQADLFLDTRPRIASVACHLGSNSRLLLRHSLHIWNLHELTKSFPLGALKDVWLGIDRRLGFCFFTQDWRYLAQSTFGFDTGISSQHEKQNKMR